MIKNNEINRDNIEKIICIDSMLFTNEEYEVICMDKNNDIESEEEEFNKDIQEIEKEYENLIDEITLKAINEKALELKFNILNNDGNQYFQKLNILKKEIDELRKQIDKSEKAIEKKEKDMDNILFKAINEKAIEVTLKPLNNDGRTYEEKIEKLKRKKNDEIKEKKEELDREIQDILDGYDIDLDFNNEQDLPNMINLIIAENYDSNNEKFKVKYMNEVKYNIKNLNEKQQEIVLEGADLYITALIENKIHTYLSKIDNVIDKIYN